MKYIGNSVYVNIKLSAKTSRIAECIITNVYEKNGKTYYSVKEKNGIYHCSNLTEKRFLYETE